VVGIPTTTDKNLRRPKAHPSIPRWHTPLSLSWGSSRFSPRQDGLDGELSNTATPSWNHPPRRQSSSTEDPRFGTDVRRALYARVAQGGKRFARDAPLLGAYLGHVSLSSTEAYLAVTPERFRVQLTRLGSARKKQLSCEDCADTRSRMRRSFLSRSRPTSRTLALPHALLGNESKVQFQLVVVMPQSLPKTQLFVTLR
jgi:hypothetical protein